MQKSFSIVLVSLLLAGALNSCYKTGEIIYQQKCKPVVIDTRAIPSPEGGMAFIGPNDSFTYSSNRQLIIAKQTQLIQGQQYRTDCYFTYDNNNNLVNMKVESHPYWDQYGTPTSTFNDSFTYPPGTTNSLADSIVSTGKFVNDPSNKTYIFIYKFNTEFQLTDVINGSDYSPLSKILYDNAGNCTKVLLYIYGDQIWKQYEYSDYDDKINVGRTDRTLQLAMGLYSKNNPRRVTIYGDGSPAAGDIKTFFYTYNLSGYPVDCNNNLFARYQCEQAPSSAPGSK